MVDRATRANIVSIPLMPAASLPRRDGGHIADPEDTSVPPVTNLLPRGGTSRAREVFWRQLADGHGRQILHNRTTWMKHAGGGRGAGVLHLLGFSPSET